MLLQVWGSSAKVRLRPAANAWGLSFLKHQSCTKKTPVSRRAVQCGRGAPGGLLVYAAGAALPAPRDES